jgi:hypothetical protein
MDPVLLNSIQLPFMAEKSTYRFSKAPPNSASHERSILVFVEHIEPCKLRDDTEGSQSCDSPKRNRT